MGGKGMDQETQSSVNLGWCASASTSAQKNEGFNQTAGSGASWANKGSDSTRDSCWGSGSSCNVKSTGSTGIASWRHSRYPPSGAGTSVWDSTESAAATWNKWV